MKDLQLRLVRALQHMVGYLYQAGLPVELVEQVQLLTEQINQPCVVAVVGQVKAGKSTFVNALLGENLAKVGAIETTATINYFRYGSTNPDLPIRCYWRDGTVTEEKLQFLDDLQGIDDETLSRSEKIDYLEYLPSEQIILVDTPGTWSAVEQHQQRIAEFMALPHLNRQFQIQEHQNQQTQRIGSKADAVIYVFNEIERDADAHFLTEFQHATQKQVRSLNAIGIMAKIDLYSESQRVELAKKIAGGALRDKLNAVIPISASLQQALDALLAKNRRRLQQMMTVLRDIPPATLIELLSSSEAYLDMDLPIPSIEWEQLQENMLWTTFTTIVTVIKELSFEENAIIDKLQEIAGFKKLREILEQHFVKRAKLLHCYRIVTEVQKIHNTVRFKHRAALRQRDTENEKRRNQLLSLIPQQQDNSPIAQFIKDRLAPQTPLLDEIIQKIDKEIGAIKSELEDYNEDFEALILTQDHADLFVPEELNELQLLFGLHGLDNEDRLLPGQNTHLYLEERYDYWYRQHLTLQDRLERDIAKRAVHCYGSLLEHVE